ncbi:MAG: hypothetical protein ACLU1S_10850 [Eubacterium sp.]
MLFLIFIGVLILLWLSVIARIICLHPINTILYAVKDFYFWIKHKGYNFYEAGLLNCYCAHFGGGKTLSIVHYVTIIFNKYNNKMVWDRGRKKFVRQKIHVISNVDFKSIPYEPLASLSQVVCCAYKNKDIDIKNNTRTVVIVVLDEASAQLNSRNFKTNIDASFLNTLITSRHYHISFMYSSQKFKLTDALMRSVTQKCINCEKIWRFLIQNEYDADEVEYASNPTLIKPRKRTGFLIKDKDYNAYDTLAVVDKLKKSVDDGDMMSEQEILQMRGEMNPDNDQITHRSRRLKKLLK